MKIVLVEKVSGSYLKEIGVYTRRIGEAADFETEQEARRFCREHQINGHNIVAKFISRKMEDVHLGHV